MVLHRASRARRVGKNGIGGEVRHGVTSGVSTSPPQGVSDLAGLDQMIRANSCEVASSCCVAYRVVGTLCRVALCNLESYHVLFCDQGAYRKGESFPRRMILAVCTPVAEQ